MINILQKMYPTTNGDGKDEVKEDNIINLIRAENSKTFIIVRCVL